MSRAENIDSEFLIKSLDYFLFQSFDCGFDHIILDGLIKLSCEYPDDSSEAIILKCIIKEIESRATDGCN